MATSQRRSTQLKVTITPEIHSRLVSLSQRLGQSPATLGSMAISNYVATQENTLGATQIAVDAMVGKFAPDLQRQISEMLKDQEPKPKGKRK